MGIATNTSVMVTSFRDEQLVKARKIALRMVRNALIEAWIEDDLTVKEAEERAEAMVSPILRAAANGVDSFYIVADGSKLGWTTHEVFDDYREKFYRMLRRLKVKVKVWEIKVGEDTLVWDGLSERFKPTVTSTYNYWENDTWSM